MDLISQFVGFLNHSMYPSLTQGTVLIPDGLEGHEQADDDYCGYLGSWQDFNLGYHNRDL